MKAQVKSLDGEVTRDIELPVDIFRGLPPRSDQEGSDGPPEHAETTARDIPLCRHLLIGSWLGKRSRVIPRSPYQEWVACSKSPAGKRWP